MTSVNKKCYNSSYSKKFKEITMKKTLLLSVVASTMIMAGGDIAPVEPVVEAPAPVETSAWNYGGSLVAYTQTVDQNSDLFSSESTYAAWGVQLGATNADFWAGVGAGVEVAAIVASTGDGAGFYNNGGNAGTTSGGFTQAYLTYGIGNTSFKVGRQTLPKSLSPFAFSEGWQVFKNTFDAALVVNSSLPDTTLVYAYVYNANRSVGEYLNEDSFQKVAAWAGLPAEDGVHMVTVQNKSISNTTITGSWYLGLDHAGMDIDNTMLWGDITYKGDALTLGVQGGSVDADTLDSTTAWGAKIAGNLGMFNLMAAYTSVDDGALPIVNMGTGVKSPLYTQMVLNNVGQYHAAPGSDFLKFGGSVKGLGGTWKAYYGMGENDNSLVKGDYSQLDLMYVTKLTENTKFFAAYVYTDDDGVAGPDGNNFVRFWARYNFK